MGRDFIDTLLGDDHASRDDAESPVARALADRQVSRGRLYSASRARLFDVLASPHPNGGAVVTFDDVTES